MAVTRRSFLKTASGAAIGSLVAEARARELPSTPPAIAIVISGSDEIAASAPPTWALSQLTAALQHRGFTLRRAQRIEDTSQNEECVVAGGAGSVPLEAVLRQWNITLPQEPESLCIAHGRFGGRRLVVAAGSDAAGLGYALTELAERFASGDTPVAAALPSSGKPLLERPASRTRSVMRAFCSEVEDKAWFYDRDYWLEYLTMLATCRFNRLSFTTGMAYNYASGITDGYFVFPYPFLLRLPGYNVQAAGLPDAEREMNLNTLKFVGTECARRGLRFQLGIWTLAYHWPDSPRATYRTLGLDEKSYPDYCRDALAQLLREVPEITGVTFRVHEESGIAPSRHDFWRTQFAALARCGRRVELDLHGKNMPGPTLEAALATGQPTTVSPKYCGEHMGLGYHPASIREAEMTGADQLVDNGAGLLAGDRTFTRYGYADYLAEDRHWDVVFRIWPGTQRFLLSGDPALFSAYSRSASFCGAAGIEWTEPLFFKGRLGSGHPGGRCAYLDPSLTPPRDFEKYRYTYRLWGRLGYNPAAAPEVWQRSLRLEFGPGARGVEIALSAASRILPLVTLAHAEAADCQVYWPEIYTNVPMTDPGATEPQEIRQGGAFGEVSAFDPQLFQTPAACASALLEGRSSERYTPLEVAQWLRSLAARVEAGLRLARADLGAETATAAFRRVEEDAAIQSGIAVFFAAKLTSAVLWAIHVSANSPAAAAAAITRYREGRDAWARMAQRATRVYRGDLTYGGGRLGGHWIDRLAAFDRDIEEMRARSRHASAPSDGMDRAAVDAAIRAALSAPVRPVVSGRHTPARRFEPAAPLALGLQLPAPAPARVRLHYRHIDQAERWRSLPLAHTGGDAWAGEIPASYTAKRFALQYYFDIEDAAGRVGLFPGLRPQLATSPYFVVERPITNASRASDNQR